MHSCLHADCGEEQIIRFSNGSEGVVELCLNYTWTPVCGDKWDDSEAAVACRQLGFAGQGVVLWLSKFTVNFATLIHCFALPPIHRTMKSLNHYKNNSDVIMVVMEMAINTNILYCF